MAIRDPELTKARAVIAADKRERTKLAKSDRQSRDLKVVASGERLKGRKLDPKYLAWLHHDIPCLACEIEQNPTWPTTYPIEAAHQRHTDKTGAMLGRRVDDDKCCPLCVWHHRLAPDACDPAQKKFWDRLMIDPGEFCAALHRAFKDGRAGDEIVWRFARLARERLLEAKS